MRYRVDISEHVVLDHLGRPRYPIREQSVVVGGVHLFGKREARQLAIERAQALAGVPPWRPYRRQSWPHTRAEAHIGTPEEQMQAEAEQKKAARGGR